MCEPARRAVGRHDGSACWERGSLVLREEDLPLTSQPMMRLLIRFALIAVLTVAVVPLCEGKGAAPIQAAAPAAAQTKAAAPPAASPATARRRVIAVGDLHGDLASARQSLRLAGVIDMSDHWAAGSATFVQTGDVMDRGDDVRAILDLLRNLEREAASAGGRAVVLIGNHEMFNLVGDQASASPADLASFGGAEARRALFSQTGEYGAWLRTHKAAVIVDDTIFVHAGITPEMATLGLDALNAGVLAYLNGGAESPVVGRSGPLWLRDYVRASTPEVCAHLSEALKILGVRRMVVGHTPSDNGQMVAPCDGHLIDIDTGISASYGVHPSALEIDNGDAWAVYPGNRVDLPDPR